MKKFISLLLALVMTFSVATIAFAADETTTLPDTSTDVEAEPGTEEGDLGDFQWLLDLPLWTAKPLLKVAKIAKAVGPVLIASQRVADDVKRKKKRTV